MEVLSADAISPPIDTEPEQQTDSLVRPFWDKTVLNEWFCVIADAPFVHQWQGVDDQIAFHDRIRPVRHKDNIIDTICRQK